MESDISGQKVLLIWSGVSPPRDIQEIVDKLKERVNSDGKVSLEHVDRLKMCKSMVIIYLLRLKLWENQVNTSLYH